MAVERSEIQRGEYLPRVADGLLTQALQSSGAVQIKERIRNRIMYSIVILSRLRECFLMICVMNWVLVRRI